MAHPDTQALPKAGTAAAAVSYPWLRLSSVLVLLFFFLCGIRGLGSGFKGLGGEVLDSFFHATANPFVGLVIGILATTLVQSSSVTTSMIVALVAAPDNPLPIDNAIPMIMGANIGTTVTNTIVSLAHMGQPEEFRRAFAAATCHDFFNYIAVAILLPLELLTGFLTKASAFVASSVKVGSGPGKLPNPIKTGTKAVMKPIEHGLESLTGNPQIAAILLIVVSGIIIFACLTLIVKVLRSLTGSRARAFLTRSLDTNPYVGMLVGVIITVMVQSSSITTSVMIPLAGAGIITLAQVFPITLGANIGTTITALLATLAAPSETAHLAVQIAVVHLLFNLAGVLLIYPWKRIRQIPLSAAEWLASVATGSRKVAVIYVLVLFYGLPILAIFISSL